MADEQAAAQDQAAQQQFVTQRIYTKDISFESPMTPNVFRQEWKPAVNVDLNTKSSRFDEEGNHEVVLTITVETKHEDTVLFLVELHQAGLFLIKGYPDQELEAVIGSFCPSVLYPYAREAIASIVSKGGFPEFLLQPINFDALYAQSKEAAAREAAQQAQPEAAGGGNGAGGEA